MQSDPEPAATFNAFAEAQKRLNDKLKHRGFWSVRAASSRERGARARGRARASAGRCNLEFHPTVASAAREAIGGATTHPRHHSQGLGEAFNAELVAVACRGVDRALGPPPTVSREMAPSW